MVLVKLEQMSAPLVPSPLDYVGRRRFAFYPPIAHPDPNEWLLGVGSRTEIQIVNACTGGEVWIPWQYIGAVSETNSPLLLVGLTVALDFRGETVRPRTKRVIEMPVCSLAANDSEPHSRPPQTCPADVTQIRLDSHAGSLLNRAVATTCIGALVVALLASLIAAAASS